jgi:hypothetical protein
MKIFTYSLLTLSVISIWSNFIKLSIYNLIFKNIKNIKKKKSIKDKNQLNR